MRRVAEVTEDLEGSESADEITQKLGLVAQASHPIY